MKKQNKYNVCVITEYDLLNYGNRFQNYALLMFLEENFDVNAFYLAPIVYPSLIKKIKFIARTIMTFFQLLLQKNGILFLKKMSSFRKFLRRFKKCNTMKHINYLSSLSKKFEYFIVGSDQVISNDFGLPDFYASINFADSTKKIAYAISSGNGFLNEEKYVLFTRSIANFRGISARESNDVRNLKKLTNREVKLLPDPVFLLEKEKWIYLLNNNVSKKAKAIVANKKYAFVYWLGSDIEKANAFINNYLKNNNLEVIFARTANRGKQGGFIDMSPWDFIYLLLHSEMVFSKSFHGCAMSILFNKQFKGYDAQFESTGVHDQRLAQLADTFGVSIEHFEFFNDNLPNCNWSEVNKNISVAKQRSIDFFSEYLAKKDD